ncbi:MAG TPA: heavy metal-binding domain-containing protein [Planctomycetaceae bacterium]|nr:heavy metal-binding domain-containing protein [Planctomycetaceae bacterium]
MWLRRPTWLRDGQQVPGRWARSRRVAKSFSRGEVSELTSLIYDAREHAIGLIRDEAAAIGADDVIGIKTHVHELGGLLEFMAIGTAVKRFATLKTVSPTLPPQAIITDKDTWISHEQGLFQTVKSGKQND